MMTGTTCTGPIHTTTNPMRALLARGAAVLVFALPLALADAASGASATGVPKVTITESSNRHVVTVAKGAHLVVALHSTYWTITPLARRTVLAQVGTQQTGGSLAGPTHACAPVPGQGCGTVTMHYVAHGAGTVRLTAQRTTCGEAMRCTGSQGSWYVTVRVR
jgi:hypothetical protein